MIQKIKTSLLIIATMLLTFGAPTVVMSGVASAANAPAANCSNDSTSAINAGTNAAFSGDTCNTSTTQNNSNSIAQIARNAVNVLSLIVGIVAVIMIVYGGFRYITSGGDSGAVGNAKNTLIYAIVGLIIVALAQVIVHFVLNAALNNTVNAT